jgi:MFS family permease
MKYNNFGRFVFYISMISLGTAIASPFFAVYMLKNLKFSYSVYMLITIIPILSGLLSMTFWGKFGDNYGNMKILKILGFFIPFFPILWVISIFIQSNFLLVYLCIVEFFSGFIWAGFNLASSNFIFNAVSRERTAICFSYFNILNGIGVFIGTTIGGLISSIPGALFSLPFILIVFLISGIFRMIVQLSMFSKIDEVKQVKDFHIGDIRYNLKIFFSDLKESYYNRKRFSPKHWFEHF